MRNPRFSAASVLNDKNVFAFILYLYFSLSFFFSSDSFFDTKVQLSSVYSKASRILEPFLVLDIA